MLCQIKEIGLKKENSRLRNEIKDIEILRKGLLLKFYFDILIQEGNIKNIPIEELLKVLLLLRILI